MTRWHLIVGLPALLAGLAIVGWAVQRKWHTRANWYGVDDPRREQSSTTARILEVLALTEGLAVADIGAGPGFFAFRLARAVGAHGKVYASEIDPLMVAALRMYALRHGYRNVEVMHAATNDLGLPPTSIDRLILVNVFLFDGGDPAATRRFFEQASATLRPGGLLLVYNDWVRERGFHPAPDQPPLACSEPSPEQLVEAALPWLVPSTLERVNVGSAPARHGPGYLLALRKLP